MKKLTLLLLSLLFLLFSCSPDSAESTEKEIIHTENAPGAVGVYSQAIRAGNTLYVAGQIGLMPDSGELAGDDLETQTHQTLQNIEAVLEAAGFALTDVVQVQVYLDDMNDYGEFNDIYIGYFPENPPARAVVEVSRIPLDAKVEILATAER